MFGSANSCKVCDVAARRTRSASTRSVTQKQLRRHDVPSESGSVEGYYISLQHDGSAENDKGQPARVRADEMYEERLEFLSHHPGFIEALAELAHTPGQGALEEFAQQWAITVADLWHLAEATALGARRHVVLPPNGALVYVEPRATEFVIHVPRPVTPASREAVARWAHDAWRQPAKWSSKSEPAQPTKGKSAHLAHEAVRRVEWYDRWTAGESVQAIWDSLPSAEGAKLGESAVRTMLQYIHKRMQAISRRGLREPGP